MISTWKEHNHTGTENCIYYPKSAHRAHKCHILFTDGISIQINCIFYAI